MGLIAGIVGGFLSAGIVPIISPEGEREELIAEYYAAENAVAVSPHELRTNMEQIGKEMIVVDVRARKDYERGHITGAINIPGFSPEDASPEAGEERIVSAFRELDHSKDIITYCYSGACMLARKVGNILAEHDMYVKHLNIGWQEWRHFWDLWNSDGDAPADVMDFVTEGALPGTFTGESEDGSGSCTPDEEGKLSC